MKRVNYIFLVAVAWMSTCFFLPVQVLEAQDKITLDEAVSTALARHPALKSSELAVRVAGEQLNTEKSSRIPEVSSGLSLQRNLIIPSTPVPLGLINGQGDPAELTFLQFGTDWQSNIGVHLNYDLFNPSRKQQILAGEENRQLAEIDHEVREATVRIEVTKAYAELVLVSEQLNYAVDDTLFNHQALEEAQDQFAEGRLDEKTLNDAVLRLNQSVSRYQQSRTLYDQSRIELAYRMGVSYNPESLPLAAENLETLLIRFREEKPVPVDPSTTNGFQRLKTQALHDSLQYENTKLMMLPTVSLNASLGSNYYKNDLQLFNTGNWYGNSFVGLSLNIPLTRDIATQHKISRARLRLDQVNADIQDFQNRKEADLRKTLRSLEHNRNELDQSIREMQLAESDLNTIREKYKAGQILFTGLRKAELSLQNARMNYLQAAYDYIITRLQLRELEEGR